jgi:hypothetical protein
MAISYPIISSQATPSTGSGIANRFQYSVGQFSSNVAMVETQAYTASFDVSSWIVYVSSSVPSATTMSIAMPTASFVQAVGGGNLDPHHYSPALEFWRVDQENVQMQLSSSDPDIVFGIGSQTPTYILPTSSYTNLTQIDLGYGFGGKLVYFILEQSPLP